MIQYDPHNWFDHFFDIHGSLLKEISLRVGFCTIWSIGVVSFHFFVKPVAISPAVHSLIGVALGLLLVFRTNASYDRFWEGRKLWGGIVNETRNLVRSSEALLIHAPELRKTIALWTLTFPYSAMESLRGKKGLGPSENQLDPKIAKEILESANPPLGVVQQISLILQKAKEQGILGEFAQLNIDQNTQLLVDYLGGCERIHRTPLPFAYVVHLRRALIFYCYTLPFALLDTFGWLTVVATLLVGYIFFGIEEIGVEIEDPFGSDENDLPLDKICISIEKSIRSLVLLNEKTVERQLSDASLSQTHLVDESSGIPSGAIGLQNKTSKMFRGIKTQ